MAIQPGLCRTSSETLKTDFLITRLNYNTCSYVEIERDLLDLYINVWVLFVWNETLRPNQQFFSHIGTAPPIPGYYQYFLGGKCILLNDTTRRPE